MPEYEKKVFSQNDISIQLIQRDISDIKKTIETIIKKQEKMEQQIIVNREKHVSSEKDINKFSTIGEDLAKVYGILEGLMQKVSTDSINNTIISGDVNGDTAGGRVIK